MASSLSSTFLPTKAYEPTPRIFHCATAVGEKCYLWGGIVTGLSKSDRRKLASTIEIFDPYFATWEQHPTTGVPPSELFYGVCTSLLDSMYWFGGWESKSDYMSLHRLDTTTLEWRELQPLNQTDGPMIKLWCGIVSFFQDQLAVFGGYGIPILPIQPGATFIKGPIGIGWSNELHVFNITSSKWSSPPTSGTRPPPCSSFSFTAINNHQAVLFGGNQLGRRVEDCFLIDFEPMEWTKLKRSKGAPWPTGRDSHAACCLNYGEEHPQLLVNGGVGNDGNTLSDAWILDVNSGRWSELILPEGAQTRLRHTAMALSLRPGWTKVIMFGGCPKWQWEKSEHDQQNLAKTAILEFEWREGIWKLTRGRWEVTRVVAKGELGRPVNSLRDQMEMLQLQLHSSHRSEGKASMLEQQLTMAEESVRGLEVEKQAAETRAEIAERKIADLQRRVEEGEGRARDAEARVQQYHQRATQAEQRATQAERRATQAEERATRAEIGAHFLQQQNEEMAVRVRHAEQTAREAQERARMTEQRAQRLEARGHNQFWVVEREEIQLTDQEVGRGGWAVVRVAKFRGLRVAAKCLHTLIVSDYNRQLFVREMSIAARVRHPNLVQFIGAMMEGEPIILTELMSTSLRAVLERRPFNPAQITSISLDVARALNYLHLMHPDPIIHRDISSANILLEPVPSNSWRAKVSDYGSANFLQQLRTAGPGNPTYAAPEADIPSQQSLKMDVYSYGVLLLEICSRRFPNPEECEALLHRVQQPTMVALIRQCMEREPARRPTMSDIIGQLE